MRAIPCILYNILQTWFYVGNRHTLMNYTKTVKLAVNVTQAVVNTALPNLHACGILRENVGLYAGRLSSQNMSLFLRQLLPSK